MKPDLYPLTFEDTLVFHRHNGLKKSRKAYSLLLIFTITSLLALPWIHIETITISPGVITPPEESIELFATASGRIANLSLEEGTFVRKGDTLFSIRSGGIPKEVIIISPTEGFLRNPGNITNEAHVNIGDRLLEILPEPRLVVRCFLPGEDIVSIQPEQEVEFRVESTGESRSPTLKGKIERILPSVDSNEQTVVFEVRCTIDSANGTNHSPPLKPGMTLLTRFRLARRSAVDIILKEVKDKDQIPA